MHCICGIHYICIVVKIVNTSGGYTVNIELQFIHPQSTHALKHLSWSLYCDVGAAYSTVGLMSLSSSLSSLPIDTLAHTNSIIALIPLSSSPQPKSHPNEDALCCMLHSAHAWDGLYLCTHEVFCNTKCQYIGVQTFQYMCQNSCTSCSSNAAVIMGAFLFYLRVPSCGRATYCYDSAHWWRMIY